METEHMLQITVDICIDTDTDAETPDDTGYGFLARQAADRGLWLRLTGRFTYGNGEFVQLAGSRAALVDYLDNVLYLDDTDRDSILADAQPFDS